MTDLPQEPYICETCLQRKDTRVEGFGIVWTKNGRDAFLCKECANPILKKLRPTSE